MNYVINNTPILTNFLGNSNNNNVSHHLDNNIFPLTKYKNLKYFMKKFLIFIFI